MTHPQEVAGSWPCIKRLESRLQQQTPGNPCKQVFPLQSHPGLAGEQHEQPGFMFAFVNAGSLEELSRSLWSLGDNSHMSKINAVLLAHGQGAGQVLAARRRN